MSQQSKILLNSFGDLSEELKGFFEKADVEVVTRDEVNLDTKIDLILVDSVEQAKEKAKEFNCVERGIRIICLGRKEQVKTFLLNSGRLFMNSEFADSEIGKYALTKFIQENSNIHLDESFSSLFDNFKKFNVINHLNMGQSLDRLSTEAFDAGFNIVSLRSFVDHVVFYLTYLKQSGKAQVPFEFEYAFNEEHLAINIYAAVDSFTAEFMMDCFGDVENDEPLQFLLGVAAKSCDFLDVSYIEKPGKVVLTAFYSKNADQKIKGLAFNNIKTTSQLIAQVDKKLKDFVPQVEQEKELAEKQNKLADQDLPGGFFEIPTPPNDSPLENPEVREEVLAKVENKFQEIFPDKNITEMTAEDFGQVMQAIPIEELPAGMKKADEDYMIEMMQKKPMVEEALSLRDETRKELQEDEIKLEKVKKQISENVAEDLTKNITADQVNEILAGKQSVEEKGFNIAVDPETFVPPKFDSDSDPFAVPPGEFADPIKAAKQAVQFAEENFASPQEAQAFAIQLAQKANEHFDDPEQAKQFADILADEIGDPLPPKQQEVFKELLEAKATGEGGPAINIFASENLIPQDEEVLPMPEFVAPKQAAANLVEESQKHFEQAPEVQAFALGQIAQAREKFPDEESKQEFISEIKAQLEDKIEDPVSQAVFEKAVEFQLSDMFASNSPFMEDVGDPFAVAPGEFADPVETAKKIAEIASEKFDTPEEAQAFALNMAFQAQGKFPDPEAFASALTSEFEDSFDNQNQQQDFSNTLNAIAVGGDLPGFESDPFGTGFVANEEAVEKIKGSHAEKEAAQKIKGLAPEEEGMISIGGDVAGAEHATKVKGGKDAADNFAQSIKGAQEDKRGEFTARFSSSFEDSNNKGAFNFRSLTAADRKKELNKFVKHTLDNDDVLNGLDDTIKAFVHRSAPDKLNEALEEFAFGKGLDIASLSDDFLDEFKTSHLPAVLNSVLDDEKNITSFKNTLESVDKKEPFKVISSGSTPEKSAFNMKIRETLETSIAGMDGVTEQDGHLVISDQLMQDSNFQAIVKNSMSDAIQNNFQINDMTEQGIMQAEETLTQQIVQAIPTDQKAVKEVVKESSRQAMKEAEKEVVKQKQLQEQQEQQVKNENGEVQSHEPTVDKKTEKILMQKVKQAENEKKQLELKVKAMEVKLKASEATADKLKSIQDEAGAELDEAGIEAAAEKTVQSKEEKGEIPKTAIAEGEREKLVEDIMSGRDLTPEERAKIAKAMENEKKVRDLAKQAEVEIKKLQMETQKKEQLFRSEMNKTEKALKAKDSVIERAKEDMRNIMGKKEKELESIKGQVNELQQRLADDKSVQLKQDLKLAQKQAEDASRMSEVYKNKLENMAKAVNNGNKENNVALIEEENRNLKRLKTQLENKLNTDTKSLRSIEERYNSAKQGEMEAKNALAQYKGSLKQTQGQLKLMQTQNERLKKAAASAGAVKGAEDRELVQAKAQNVKLQDTIKRLNAKLDQAATANLDMGKKADSVAVQKATKDLEAAQKEVNLVKSQNEKLQAMIEKLKKENQDVPIKSADPDKLAEVAEAKAAKAEDSASKEVDLLKAQNEELQQKLKKAVDKIKKADEKSDEEPSKKEERLERSIKSMNQELTKAKNESAELKKKAISMKTKVTGLENEIKKLKKENERLSKAKGGKKAA